MRFKPRLVFTLAALAGIAATVALANWQLTRAQDKAEARSRLETLGRGQVISLSPAEAKAEDLLWRRVSVRGRFEPRHEVLLDNRIHQGAPGYHVLTPLAIEGGERHVLVNRGWIAGTGDRSRPPRAKTPAGVVEITGLAVLPSRRFLELSADTAQGTVWQNLTLERYREAVPIALQPVVIQQESALDDGLIRDWPAPDFGIEKHYGYAFQWSALAVTILVLYVVLNLRRI